ncbi:MAG: DMT family transporter [Anaerolineales bacterium]|nr:DMT family transporter [Anaerolineales bacterium]
MNGAFAAIVFGLTSALVWGTGDFLGGLGSRRASVLSVLLIAESSGLILLLALAWLWHEPIPTPAQMGWGVAAGIAGTLGLGALYVGLASSRASIVAPVSAVVGALLPAVYSILTIGLPDTTQQIGFALAIGAIILVSYSNQGVGELRALGMAILAGLGFGLYFIFIHQSGQDSTFFPLVFARGISIPFLLVLVLWRKAVMPPRSVLPIVIASGLFDVGGNVFFVLSSQVGRLDVATILASLYPATTVILSRIVLHEHITRLQASGVFLALAAIVLIAL